MSGAVAGCNELVVAVIVHPVKVAAYDILGHVKHKGIGEGIFTGKHRPLYPFCIPDTCRDVPVLLLYLFTLLHNFCRSFCHFLLKDLFFVPQISFPYFHSKNHSCGD